MESSGGSPIVAAWTVGIGRVILIGYDYWAYGDGQARIIANAVATARLAGGRTVSLPDTVLFRPGQTVEVPVLSEARLKGWVVEDGKLVLSTMGAWGASFEVLAETESFEVYSTGLVRRGTVSPQRTRVVVVSSSPLEQVRLRFTNGTVPSVEEVVLANGVGAVHRVAAVRPQVTQLGAGYPNPFNAQTVIPYQLSSPSQVNLVVYDILGQPVRVLESGQVEAGFHRVTWDGTDERGKALATGVYYVRLRLGDHSQTRPLTLLK